MEYAALEGEGGKGTAFSHWERLNYGDEAMTSTDMHEAKYSSITMALLEDSGWYKPNYKMADTFTFGKGKGCDFVNNNCKIDKKYEEYCFKKGEYGCSLEGDRAAECKSDGYSNGCMTWGPLTVKGSSFSDNNKCVALESSQAGW